jgi:hypothetical protein
MVDEAKNIKLSHVVESLLKKEDQKVLESMERDDALEDFK